MIIVKLIGGLGNQLFQYAAGLRLALLHQTALKLDPSPFEYYKLHRYSLAPFCIQEVFASPEEITKIIGASKQGLSRFIFQISQKLKPYYRRAIFREYHFKPFNPDIFRTPKNLYLDGYWQSEKYFIDIADRIRGDFQIKYEQGHQSREIGAQISNTQSVGIHVRRGDYVSNQLTYRIHGTMSLDYYQRCISFIIEKVAQPHFFIFSDDPDWVIENLNLNYPTTFVTHNDASKNYED
jgi:hypothetical protein